MKGYVYVGASLAIIILSVFLIYLWDKYQETVQNNNRPTHLQITPMQEASQYNDEIQHLQITSNQETSQNNVEIQNISVQPDTIKVGDTFSVNATLVNNSQNPIEVIVSQCVSPSYVFFNGHVTVDTIQMICLEGLKNKIVNHGEKDIIVYPIPNVTFRATEAGITNAIIMVSYIEDNADYHPLNPQKDISKSFLFTILDQSAKQTTESNEFYKPTISDDQVAQIITSDLSKHLPTFTKVIIEGRDPIPNNPDYPKHPLRLWYVAPNGTQFFINSTYSLVGECAPNDTYCGIHDPSGFKITSGRLVYYVDLLWYAKDNLNGPAQYVVDAHNGDVLYSTLLENMTPQDIKNKYVP